MDERVTELLHKARRLSGAGRLEEASVAANEALRLVEAEGTERQVAHVLGVLSEIRADRGEQREALASAERAAGILRAVSRHPEEDLELAHALSMLAERLRREGKTAEAFQQLAEADSILSRLGEHELRRLDTLPELWRLALETGRPAQALSIAREVEHLTPPDEGPLSADIHRMLGEALLALERVSEAMWHFEQLLAYCRSVDAKKGRPTGQLTMEAERWVAIARTAAERKRG